jgi:hypothetical protein
VQVSEGSRFVKVLSASATSSGAASAASEAVMVE